VRRLLAVAKPGRIILFAPAAAARLTAAHFARFHRDPSLADYLDGANWLSPFGAEIRYPGDRPKTLPSEELRARELALKVRDAAMAVLDPYLSGI
jgi:hypothetical protein